MRVKHALAATTAALLLTTSGFALAQQTAPGAADRVAPSSSALPAERNSASFAAGTLHEVKENDMAVPILNVTKKDLTGMDIYGSDGKKIGDVDKVLADSSNSVKAVTADVGGFLGIGAREVVIPIDKLSKGSEKDRLQVSMTKDEIQNLAKWEDPDRGASRTPSSAETPRTAPSTPPSR